MIEAGTADRAGRLLEIAVDVEDEVDEAGGLVALDRQVARGAE